MRTNRCSSSTHTRQKTHKSPTETPAHVCLRGACGPKCEWHKRVASGANCRREREAAHEDPELTVNHEEVTSLHGHNAAFQAVDRTLLPTCLESSHLQFQVKVRSNWAKKVSSTPKGPHCTMTSCRRATARSEARRSQSDLSLDPAVVALVVRNTKVLALHDDPTPIDTDCCAYTQRTGTQNSQGSKLTSSPKLVHGPRARCARCAQHHKG